MPVSARHQRNVRCLKHSPATSPAPWKTCASMRLKKRPPCRRSGTCWPGSCTTPSPSPWLLKIQVQLMRDAVQSGNSAEMKQVLEEIDIGVRESYGDVRELLLHFRTRTNAEDIEPALA